jgi:hypothetical protein
MRTVDARTWLATGEDATTKQRFDMSQEFCAWSGAGVFVGTVGAVGQGLSFKGVDSIQFWELCWSAGQLRQAESRGDEPGKPKVDIVYFVLRKSVDEHIESVVLSKLDTQVRMTDDPDAEEVKVALGGGPASNNVDAIWERLTAHLREGDDS